MNAKEIVFFISGLDLIRVSLRKGYLSIALELNCKMWICGKFMYHFILFGKDFEDWFCNLAYFQKMKKDQCCLVDHIGKM